MEFFVPGEEELELMSELDVEVPATDTWFEAEAGLQTIRAFLGVVGELPLEPGDLERVEADLQAFQSALVAALQSGSRWRLGIDI